MDQDATERYRSMAARLEAGDLTVDLGELRRAYADSADFTTESSSALQAELMDAMGKRDFPRAIRSAQKAIETKYANIHAHHALYFAYRETGDEERFKFHFAVWKGLIDSILRSGDGKSETTAYEVMSIDEEYLVLRILGLVPVLQSLKMDGDHKCDVMKAKNPATQEEVKLYFNIDKFFGR